MATFKTNLTESFISKIEPPAKGRDYYYDTKERGLVLNVTDKGSKAFYLYKKVNNSPIRVKIADADSLNVTAARKAANDLKADLHKGKNPNAEKQKFRQEATLKELFTEYMSRYSKKYKKAWKADEVDIQRFFSQWFHRKISDITKQNIASLHAKIGEENGTYQANRILDRIKSMYSKAIEWGWDGANPAKGVKKFKEIKRDRFLQPAEFPAFFKALEQDESEEARNYVWMSLLTGARKSNVLAMRWDEIDFDRGVWRIPDTKNGDPLDVPLIEKAIDLLNATERKSEWVFPSPDSKTGHLQDPKKAWARILKRAGIQNLRLHDIRRTLGSYQAIMGASLPIIGKSLGHKSSTATQIYARLNDDPVRHSMQAAVGKMLEYKKDD